MTSEMPVKHWSTLPETEKIPELLREAPGDVKSMRARAERGADPPEEASWGDLRESCRACRACEQCEGVGEAVVGEGPRDARIVVVGEQPGRREQEVGRPFVGPAGEVLEAALGAVGLDRDDVYLTNAVKHYGYVEKEGQHLHDSPDRYITEMCEPWLHAELEFVSPGVVLALGRTAASSLAGRRVSIGRERGSRIPVRRHGAVLVPTYHPGAVLRATPAKRAGSPFEALVGDLERVAAMAVDGEASRGRGRVEEGEEVA